ncbi:response regulator transcription factor [Corynebacterium lowii]|uniref:Oxygen regulatory protein NreC n=1 Tax=Corynebacterium lowii TaxID=1544413 RepID=A0A0Q0YWU1_9CORY|nr:response regulator transcription factor [Corynebacterium lowii]KQB86838.1 Oxygen regulatory protein NreC [Corynebacterium lowii]MDP9851526.1 DNA-binding NarL/FixJ family response regulator [Corynebacterium lowii]
MRKGSGVGFAGGFGGGLAASGAGVGLSVVIADDSALLREGVAALLERRGHRIVGQAADSGELMEVMGAFAVQGSLPDVLITDVRMPPNMADDGLKAAVRLRAEHPDLAVMVLSQYVAPAYAVELFAHATSGTGYLLKDRVSEVADFLNSLAVVAQGGTVIDPTVASALMASGRSGLGELTPREREVLELMSRGQSNREIAQCLVLSSAAVAKHVSNIFSKLRLSPAEENRRVKAILEYLAAGG